MSAPAMTESTAPLKPEALEALARAYDREDASQRGEPSPWADESDAAFPAWRSERLACAEVGLRAYLAASRTPQEQGVKVKRLEWRLEDDDWWGAESIVGNYEVRQARASVRVRFCGERKMEPFEGTIDEAKAVAQADYERRILSALSIQEPASEPVASLDERMEAAGMVPLSKLLTGDTPLAKWEAHAGVRTLAHFEEWLLRRHSEFMTMRARYAVGDKDESDELYEWVLAHSGAFSEVVANWRQVTATSILDRTHPPAPAVPSDLVDDGMFGNLDALIERLHHQGGNGLFNPDGPRAAGYIASLRSAIVSRTAERDEARAEIERMTPQFVAYEYLESPERADRAEAALASALDVIKPFAEEALEENGEPRKDWKHAPDNEMLGLHMYDLTFGHFRTAVSFLQSQRPEQ